MGYVHSCSYPLSQRAMDWVLPPSQMLASACGGVTWMSLTWKTSLSHPAQRAAALPLLWRQLAALALLLALALALALLLALAMVPTMMVILRLRAVRQWSRRRRSRLLQRVQSGPPPPSVRPPVTTRGSGGGGRSAAWRAQRTVGSLSYRQGRASPIHPRKLPGSTARALMIRGLFTSAGCLWLRVGRTRRL